MLNSFHLDRHIHIRISFTESKVRTIFFLCKCIFEGCKGTSSKNHLVLKEILAVIFIDEMFYPQKGQL